MLEDLLFVDWVNKLKIILKLIFMDFQEIFIQSYFKEALLDVLEPSYFTLALD